MAKKEEANDKDRRRVYVLPAELVDRIVEFQKEKKLPSEVEAVRRLLDEALMRRDSFEDIIVRFQNKLDETSIMSDVVKEVLIGHPLIASIKMNDDSIQYEMTNGYSITIKEDKSVLAYDELNNTVIDGLKMFDNGVPF